MTPEQWERISALFGQARELPEQERAALLDHVCAGDDTVRAEVVSLLAADRDDAFLERGASVRPGDLLDDAAGTAYREGDRMGPYVVERLLARGGMGVLYLARDPRLGRQVTLKVLPAAAARDPAARTRLQREARTAARLRHPHIVSIHALEEYGDTLTIVAEYVEGPTLADVVDAEGPLPRNRWLQVACALAEALAAAHASGVVHRDVKSRNVVMGRDGLRLVDFGIALVDSGAADTRLTRAGQLAGTPLAMAPEQLEGAAATALSDQYAYGLVLYEAASGCLPFGDGPIAGVWARMLRDEPVPLAACAPQLTRDDVALVHRCLARRPEDRFPSMQAVIEALEPSASPPGGSVPAGSPGTAPAPVPAPRVRGRAWWDVHQGTTSVLYVALLWPGWLVAGALPLRWRPVAHVAIVCLAAIATSLRLHLWFSARQYPESLARARLRWWPALMAVDVAYAVLLAGFAAWAADTRLVPAVVTAGLAMCLLMATIVIEPATRQATEHL